MGFRSLTTRSVVTAGPLVIAGLALAVAAVLLVPRLLDDHSAKPRVIEGVVQDVNVPGNAFAVDNESYLVPRWWQEATGKWHDSGQPDCLQAGTRGERVAFGVIDVESVNGVDGVRDHVVWVRCLTD